MAIRVTGHSTDVALKSFGTAISTREYSFPSNFNNDSKPIPESSKNMVGKAINIKLETKVIAVGSSGSLSVALKHKKKASDSTYTTYAVYGPFSATDINSSDPRTGEFFRTALPESMYANFKLEASGTAFTSGDIRIVVE